MTPLKITNLDVGIFYFKERHMYDKRLKALEVEIAYLRKAIETLIKTKPIEIHNHHYYDYNTIMDIINNSIQDSQQ